MSIYNYQRWINWKVVQRPRSDGTLKDDKVPWDYLRNEAINAHDANNWMTFDDARRSGHPLGFVFVARDPYFFLDLDRCRAGDGWRREAEQVCAMFPGAAMEISQSGNGIHIVGRCDKLITASLKNKFGREIAPDLGLWCEFYTADRFMALGHGFNHYDFDRDYTSTLLQLVPAQETDESIISGAAGPVPEYTGPADDDELIRRMFVSQSANSSFGIKATANELWNATRYSDRLSRAYPSQSGDVFDRSSADAALMSHLAFWTGKDAARMDRLFRRSDLMREKYLNRPDYRNRTIGNAVRRCSAVYDAIRNNESSPVPVGETSELLTVADQINYFAGCIFVRSENKVLVPSGEMMAPNIFRATYGGKTFLMSQDGTGSTKNAFEAFTENRVHRFPNVARTCFRPEASPHTIIDDQVNIYTPFFPKTMRGDPSPFLNHLQKLIPDNNDRAILLAYMAALVQHPGRKFRWAPLVQGTKGNGKTFLAQCVEYAVGSKYSHKPAANDLKNPFNSYLENKLLIVVEEVHVDGRRDLLDMLKPLITDERIEVQPKGVDKRMIDNRANWIFFSNHRDAITIDKDERRYAPFFTAQQTYKSIIRDGMGGDYFPNLFNWARDVGFQIVADYLQHYQIPDELNPATMLHRAPPTTSTDAAISVSKGRAEQEVEEAIINQLPGFRGGWLSSHAAQVMLLEHGIKMAPTRLSEMIVGLGYRSIGRSNNFIIQEGNKRPKLYVLEEMWTPSLSLKDYMVAQGYVDLNATVQNVIPLRR